MKALKLLLIILFAALGLAAQAQSIVIYKADGSTLALNAEEVDSIAYNPPNPLGEEYYYYVGWTEPTAENIKTIINEEYYYKLDDPTVYKAGGSTTVIGGFGQNHPLKDYYNVHYRNYVNGALCSSTLYYVVPEGISFYGADGCTYIDQFVLFSTFKNHRVYIEKDREGKTSMFHGALVIY